MRAAGPIPAGALPAVLAYRPGALLPGTAEIERELGARIVTLTDIDIAIRIAIANPGGYLPLARVSLTSRVAIKMAAGHCADNSIERAEQLRLDYQKYPAFLLIDSPRLALNTAEALSAALYRRMVIQTEASRGKLQLIIADNEVPVEYRRDYAEIDFTYERPTVSTVPLPGPAAVRTIGDHVNHDKT